MLDTRLQLLLLLTQRHTLFAGRRDAVRQGGDTRFQFLVQRFQLIDIELFTLTLAEFSQQTLGFLLFAQTLFQLAQTHAQWLNLFRQVALFNAFAQQLTRHAPGFTTRQRAVDSRHQLVSLFELAVRSLRHAHFLFQRQQLLGRFLLFGLEGFQPFSGAIGGQIR